MGEYPDFGTPDRWQSRESIDADEADAARSKQSLQEIAHDRGRICKKRGCVVCAPLVERRRLNKKKRKAEAQALLHAKGQPCGRSSCSLTACVEARTAVAESTTEPSSEPRVDSSGASHSGDPHSGEPRFGEPGFGDGQMEEPRGDGDRVGRRQAERHRVGLPCGSEDCPRQVCVDGFANERTRRHRARRPCRSASCDNAICVAGRSTT